MVTSDHGEWWWYEGNKLEKVEERKEDMKKEFTRNDLKDGMLLELREGERFLWLNRKPRNFEDYIECTMNNLKNSQYKSLDIVKVGYPNKNACTIEEMLSMDFSEVIWIEEQVTKDISMEELNKILKEKFPDVDHFNLPIKEE